MVAGRQDNKLIGTDALQLAVAHAIPSRTIHTIYKYVLGYWNFAFAIVATGMRIVSDVGDVQARHKRVGLFHVYDHLWQYNRTFADESVFLFHMCKCTYNSRDSHTDIIKNLFLYRKDMHKTPVQL